MAGRTINLNKTVKLEEVGDHGEWSVCQIWDIRDETWSDRYLERYKGDTIDKCSDEPYLFSSEPVRYYNTRRTPEHNDPLVYSVYGSIGEFRWWREIYTKKEKDVYSIILIADLMFAGAVFQEKDTFRDRVQTVLKNWEEQLKASSTVFLRCTKEDFDFFFEGKDKEKRQYGRVTRSNYRHVPFETGKPTLAEVDRVYDRLMRCVVLGSPETALRDLQNETKSLKATNKVKEVSASTSEGNRRLEKKTWPWLDSTLAKRLVEFVEKDDGNALYDEVEAHSKKSQLVEYLNWSQEKFNNGTFLHYAVQQESVSVIEVLLELGCDPTFTDTNNKAPYDYSRTSEVQEKFIEFKKQNPNLFNWKKTNIPDKTSLPVHNQRKKEVEVERKIDVSRKKRSEKLQGKKIRRDDY